MAGPPLAQPTLTPRARRYGAYALVATGTALWLGALILLTKTVQNSAQFSRLHPWILLLSAVGQMAVVPATPEALIGVVAGNTLVMVVLFGLAYSLSFGGALLATFLLAIEGGLGYALLQLVDATLRSIGDTTF